MLTRVLLIRHAESADPTVFHGAESDIGLSERGERQAAALAEVLAASAPHAVVSSAMRRARATAEPLAKLLDRELLIEPHLHERRVGALRGTSTQGVEGVWPDTLRRWMAGETHYAPPGAESFDQIRERVLPVWRRLTRKYEGQTTAVVAHGVVCKVLLLSLLPDWTVADWQRLGPIRNAAVSELVDEGSGWRAVRLNVLADAVARV
jgi:broad specificity phosphatase PhoE